MENHVEILRYVLRETENKYIELYQHIPPDYKNLEINELLEEEETLLIKAIYLKEQEILRLKRPLNIGKIIKIRDIRRLKERENLLKKRLNDLKNLFIDEDQRIREEVGLDLNMLDDPLQSMGYPSFSRFKYFGGNLRYNVYVNAEERFSFGCFGNSIYPISINELNKDPFFYCVNNLNLIDEIKKQKSSEAGFYRLTASYKNWNVKSDVFYKDVKLIKDVEKSTKNWKKSLLPFN